MEKYKVCPSCGEHNDPRLAECINCGTDLFSVKVVDEATENITYEPETQSPMVKICECGAENPPAARKCSACDEDISDILPTPKTECCCKQYSLCEISGAYTYDIPNDTEIILGRENVLKEYIVDKSYVSRSHAKIVSEGENLYITNLSGTNFTYVNNEKIANDTPTSLKADDEIGLGGCVNNGNRQDLAVYLVVREK
jgi:ribosomal protein L40E